MPIELRIVSGALAGQSKRFDQNVVVIGRQGGLDLRFDPHQDLDVSGRHAEIRIADGRFVIHDTQSTNGTFVNDRKISGTVELKDGDKIRFGAKGPEATVHLSAQDLEALRRTPARSTEQRIAVAVSQQTAGLKKVLIAVLGVLVVGTGGALYFGNSQSKQRMEQFQKLLDENERLRVSLQSSDTTLASKVRGDLEALRGRLPGATTDAERSQISTEIADLEGRLRRMVQMDLPAIFKQNAPAVAIIVSDIDGKPYAGSGFSISADGAVITNRHNVLMDGKSATRLFVKFTDTRDWLPAHVVKVSDDPDEDVALIKMDRPGPYPRVAGISAAGSEASEGMSVVTIGYPLGYSTPMEGEGNQFIAKSSLNPGTVSKRTSSVLQIDSYATHGSSGSPVFSARGLVVGLIYGGAREAGGKIVYAVPPEKLAAFIPAEHRSIVKD
jgi:S1-C subfamily serine protease